MCATAEFYVIDAMRRRRRGVSKAVTGHRASEGPEGKNANVGRCDDSERHEIQLQWSRSLGSVVSKSQGLAPGHRDRPCTVVR